jgi:hypothetical protein
MVLIFNIQEMFHAGIVDVFYDPYRLKLNVRSVIFLLTTNVK